jgi:uncharacterized protein (DUF433 family)
MRKNGQWINRQPLYERCSKGHPNITVAPGVMDGMPHVAGTVVTVSLILARVRAFGSIPAVTESYPDISQEQIEEALSFAQTFLEIACELDRGTA